MSMLGKGALLVWHDIAAGGESDYNEWHSKEHMLERVGVPGFLRGHRYKAVSGSPQFLDFYEVADLATLTSAPYLECLNHPTPWTQKAVGTFRNTNRTLCCVIASVGNGICGHLLTIQLATAPGRDDALGRWLAETVPSLIERQGVLGAHYLEGDQAASRTETEEKRLRGTPDAIADWVVLVAGYDGDALQAVRAGQLADRELQAHGASGPPIAGIYRLLHTITEPDLGA